MKKLKKTIILHPIIPFVFLFIFSFSNQTLKLQQHSQLNISIEHLTTSVLNHLPIETQLDIGRIKNLTDQLKKEKLNLLPQENTTKIETLKREIGALRISILTVLLQYNISTLQDGSIILERTRYSND